jgi:GT2 family glycosyltransferase
MKEIKLTIGIPMLFPYVHWKFWKAYENLIKPKNTKLQVVTGTTIAIARNKLVNFSMDTDYLLFLDSDMIPPPDLIERLLEHDKDIVSAMAFQRSYPHKPTALRLVKEPADYLPIKFEEDLQEVDAIGCACLLIKTDVFKKLNHPWFDFSVYKQGQALGEDIKFCQKAKEAGYKIFVDTELECGHITDRIIGRADFVNRDIR